VGLRCICREPEPLKLPLALPVALPLPALSNAMPGPPTPPMESGPYAGGGLNGNGSNNGDGNDGGSHHITRLMLMDEDEPNFTRLG